MLPWHRSCAVPRAHHAKGTSSAWGCSDAALGRGTEDNVTKQQPPAPGAIFLPPIKNANPIHPMPGTEEQSHPYPSHSQNRGAAACPIHLSSLVQLRGSAPAAGSRWQPRSTPAHAVCKPGEEAQLRCCR